MNLTRPETWDAIGGSATCQIFAAGAGISAGIAVNSVLTGQVWGVVGGGAGLIAANALAAANGCYPVNPDPGPGDGTGEGIASGQCMETDGCYLLVTRGSPSGSVYNTVQKLVSAVSSGEYPNGTPKATITYVNCSGDTVVDEESAIGLFPLYTTVQAPGVCVGDPSPDNPDAEPGPAPVPVPDPEGGPCTYETRLVDSYINAAGSMSILYETCRTGADCPNPGCERFWYHGPGNVQPAPPEPIPGPDGEPLPPNIPDAPGGPGDPGGNCPDPCPPNEPCRFEPTPPIEASITAQTFDFQAYCDRDENDELLTAQFNLAGAADIGACFEALARQNLTIMQVLQQHLNWKQGKCNAPPKLGDWVTVRFESAGPSPSSNRPLRKLFRYRSQSGRDLGATTEYWKDFQWSAGPVCVIHKGAWWGVPQVWAATADEGKRVIRHAAGEAGLDPDQVGGWTISGSDNPRYGMPGQMSVAEIDFGPWVTKRDGPSGMPPLASDP